MRPSSPTPPCDLLFVALAGAAFGLLTTPPHLLQEPPDMAGMIRYGELRLDQIGHAPQRPQLGLVSSRRRAALKQLPQSLPLRFRELRGSARRGHRRKSLRAFQMVGLIPSVNRTHRGVHGARHCKQALPGIELLDGPPSPCFQLLRGTWRSHATDYSKTGFSFPLLMQRSIGRSGPSTCDCGFPRVLSYRRLRDPLEEGRYVR